MRAMLLGVGGTVIVAGLTWLGLDRRGDELEVKILEFQKVNRIDRDEGRRRSASVSFEEIGGFVGDSDDLFDAMKKLSILDHGTLRKMVRESFDNLPNSGENRATKVARGALLALVAESDSLWLLEELTDFKVSGKNPGLFEHWVLTAFQRLVKDDPETACDYYLRVCDKKIWESPHPNKRAMDHLVFEYLVNQDFYRARKVFPESSRLFNFATPSSLLNLDSVEQVEEIQSAWLEGAEVSDQKLEALGFLGGKSYEVGGESALIRYFERLGNSPHASDLYEKVLKTEPMVRSLLGKEGADSFVRLVSKIEDERVRFGLISTFNQSWWCYDIDSGVGWIKSLPGGEARDQAIEILILRSEAINDEPLLEGLFELASEGKKNELEKLERWRNR